MDNDKNNKLNDEKLNDEKLSDVAGGKSQYFPDAKRDPRSLTAAEAIELTSPHRPKPMHRRHN